MSGAIGIFGGSFDPVHKGHMKLASFMCEKLNLDKMLIIPTSLSPFKSESGATSEQRLEMCKLAFSEKIYEVCSIELDRGGKSYTIDTVLDIKRRFPESKLFLILGSDQLLCFCEWNGFQGILKNATVCAVTREDKSLLSEMEKYANENLRQYGECLILNFEPLNISSTEIRKRISDGLDVLEYLPSKVLDYITSRGLYKDE